MLKIIESIKFIVSPKEIEDKISNNNVIDDNKVIN